MKLFLTSLFLVAFSNWMSSAVASPKQDKVEKDVEIVMVRGAASSDEAPCIKIIKSGEPCVLTAGTSGDAAVFVAKAGAAPFFVSTGDNGAKAYAVALASGTDDGRSEDNEKLHWVSKSGGDGVAWISKSAGDEKGGWLGISIGAVPESLVAQLDIEGEGIMILNVSDDSPADEAGLRAHDIILAIDDDDIDGNTGRAVQLIKSHKPGDEVEIIILRDGREERIVAELGERTGDAASHFRFKFGPGSDAEIHEQIRTRGKMIARDDEGNWVVHDLGDLGELMELKELPDKLRMFLPKGGERSMRISIDGDQETVTVRSNRDGEAISVTREGDGPLTVTRVDSDGNETSETYDDADALRDGDEEAYDLWDKVDSDAVIDIDLRDIELPDIDLSDVDLPHFEFKFDMDNNEWKEHMAEWKEHMEGSLGKIYEFRDDAMEDLDGAMEDLHVMLEGLKDAEGLEAIEKLHVLRPMLHGSGKSGMLGRFGGAAHFGKPKHSFEVQADGSIEVRIRKGDSELVQLFEDGADLARRSPNLYDKYEELMSLEDDAE